MTRLQLQGLALSIAVIVAVAGCGSPTPPTVHAGPPAPPAPVPEPKPTPPPPKLQPDPYEMAMSEISTVLKRYGAVYANAKDEATGDKAIEEIGRMTIRLRELTAEIAKIPYRAGQEKRVLALQADLTQLQTAQLSNPEMQRVLSDPDLGLKFIAAHQSFVTEGLLPLGQTVMARQANESSQPDAAVVPQHKPSGK